jgi:hypothetical protein
MEDSQENQETLAIEERNQARNQEKQRQNPKIFVDKQVKSMVYEYKKENREEYVEIHVDMLTNYDTNHEHL